jgi:hypothetical protein
LVVVLSTAVFSYGVSCHDPKFQFRLRTMIIIITVGAVLLGIGRATVPVMGLDAFLLMLGAAIVLLSGAALGAFLGWLIWSVIRLTMWSHSTQASDGVRTMEGNTTHEPASRLDNLGDLRIIKNGTPIEGGPRS